MHSVCKTILHPTDPRGLKESSQHESRLIISLMYCISRTNNESVQLDITHTRDEALIMQR